VTGSVPFSVASKSRKTLSGPTSDVSLFNTFHWRVPKRASYNSIRSRQAFSSTSTPRRLNEYRKVGAVSKTIKRDYEDKFNYQQLIELYSRKEFPPRYSKSYLSGALKTFDLKAILLNYISDFLMQQLPLLSTILHIM
jgi:hypothetical protein